MKIKHTLLVLSIIVIFPLKLVCACTSFAVYGDQVYYGMNFDFINLPVKFLISSDGDMRSFHLAFEQPSGSGKMFINTAGMNNTGLFASCQLLHPVNQHPSVKTDANIFTFELYGAMAVSRSVTEIEQICRRLPIVDIPGMTLHNLFADMNGRAIITEAYQDKTVIIEKKNNFIVMTNFPNRSMIGKKYETAKGIGADRYIICHEYLQQHARDFNVEKGFDLLSMCRNKDPEYRTRCSMMFDPQKKAVYIVLDTDFSKILRFSINKGTIETVKGYEKGVQLTIPSGDEGILISELKHRLQ